MNFRNKNKKKMSETNWLIVFIDEESEINFSALLRSLFIHFIDCANAARNEIEMKAARPAIHFLSQSNQLRALAALSWWKEMNGLIADCFLIQLRCAPSAALLLAAQSISLQWKLF